MDDNASRPPSPSTSPLQAPHPPLPQYYGLPDNRLAFLQNLFDVTAPHYDRIGQLLSLGRGRWYRRQALLRAGMKPGMRLLDVAIGTGAVAREAITILGPDADIIGIDLSQGMLVETRRHLAIPLVRGRMEMLPFADRSFDFLSMGYALRHVSDLGMAFREFRRVLRPGGTVVFLELGKPSTPMRARLVRIYLGHIIPSLARWTSGMAEAKTLMRYYWDTIDQCVSPEKITAALSHAGFTEVRCNREFDVFRTFIGIVS